MRLWLPLIALFLLVAYASDAQPSNEISKGVPKPRAKCAGVGQLVGGGMVILLLTLAVFAFYTHLLQSGLIIAGLAHYQWQKSSSTLLELRSLHEAFPTRLSAHELRVTYPVSVMLKEEDGFKMWISRKGGSEQRMLVREYQDQMEKVDAELKAMRKMRSLEKIPSSLKPSRFVYEGDGQRYVVSDLITGAEMGSFENLSTHQAAWLLFDGAHALKDLHYEVGLALGAGAIRRAAVDREGRVKLVDFTESFAMTRDNYHASVCTDLISLARVVFEGWSPASDEKTYHDTTSEDGKLMSIFKCIISGHYRSPNRVMKALKAKFPSLSEYRVEVVSVLLELQKKITMQIN